MVRRSPCASLLLLAASLGLAGCGGGSSPAAPAPVPTPVPTPAPTPTPRPLSVIPGCPLASSRPTALWCPDANTQRGATKFAVEVNAAIDRVIRDRPDIFDLQDVTPGGPKIRDYNAYMTAVVAALGEGGLCGQVDAEGEIGVKANNEWSEQWSIWISKDYPRRRYLYGCTPALF